MAAGCLWLCLQALHFFIGLGALISPLVAEPFLTEDSCARNTNWTLKYHFFQNGSNHEAAERLDPISGGGAISSVSYAFWIMALINVSPHAD